MSGLFLSEFHIDTAPYCYYNKIMEYEWDERKRVANLMKHGIDFGITEGFCWNTALETIDDRADYGEKRWIALGLIDTRVHVLIYTKRAEKIRIISLRKANKREVEYYEKN